jgi:HxlR-like helix-turn-helix protein
VDLPGRGGGPDTGGVKDYRQDRPIACGEGAPGIPKTVLSERLAGLARYGIVERRPNPAGRGSTYHLTPSGQELADVCHALGTWGARWLEVAPEQLDAHLVPWAMARLVARAQGLIAVEGPPSLVRAIGGWALSPLRDVRPARPETAGV